MELRKNLQSYYLSKAGISGEKLPDAIVSAGNTNRPPAEDVFVRKVRDVIERHITEPNFSVEKLSKLVFMSHSQLPRKLEAITGCAPNKFIHMVRLERAKQLLQQQQHNIARVAIDCGYKDPGYFARIFRQETGASPQEWRIKKDQTG